MVLLVGVFCVVYSAISAQAVDGIRDILDAPLYVKECMVDRICSDRLITEDAVRPKLKNCFIVYLID